MSNIDKNLRNVNDSIPPLEHSQECCQQDDPVVLFALVLGDQWLLIHLLDLHLLLAQRSVVGFVHKLEFKQLLLTG